MGVKSLRYVAYLAVNSLPLSFPFELNIFLPRFFFRLTPLKRLGGIAACWSAHKVGRFLSLLGRRESSLLPFLHQRLTRTKAEREKLKFYGELGANGGGRSAAGRPKKVGSGTGM